MPSNAINMPNAKKLLNVHQSGKYVNIYATFEVAPINDVARITVQRKNQ